MRALIVGISGQDGSYLAQFLLRKGYQVFGASRDAQSNSFKNLDYLGIRDEIKIKSTSLNDFRSVLQLIHEIQPDEIYNLSGQSSVRLSFELPIETFESITLGTINMLEAIRFLKLSIKYYNACSSECFGDVGTGVSDENTPFRPKSPYAVAKSAAFWATANYREAYDLFACSGILFNHESPLRPEKFVTQKIVKSACRIANGSNEKLSLGNIDIQRDWGWAPEYVGAMYLMLQQSDPDDFIIATGESFTLKDFVKCVFDFFKLNWEDHVIYDSSLIRPAEIMHSRANPEKAKEVMSWQAKSNMYDVVDKLIRSCLEDMQQDEALCGR